jgi:hypothetical protein
MADYRMKFIFLLCGQHVEFFNVKLDSKKKKEVFGLKNG